MSRWRFWLAQLIWVIALVAAAGTAADTGSGESIPIALFIGFLMTGFVMKWGSHKQVQQETRIESFMIPRVIATGFMWLMYLAGVFVSAEELGGLAILLALVLMIPLIVASALMWSWERISGVKDARMLSANKNEEKRKRDRIDSVLRDMSSEDLQRLKQRLADSSLDDEFFYEQMVGDDGELVHMDERKY